MITPTKPGTLIRRGKQRLNLRTREEMYLRSRKPLTGNGENALDLGGVVRRFECCIPKKGVNGGQPQIAAACAQAMLNFSNMRKVSRYELIVCGLA